VAGSGDGCARRSAMRGPRRSPPRTTAQVKITTPSVRGSQRWQCFGLQFVDCSHWTVRRPTLFQRSFVAQQYLSTTTSRFANSRPPRGVSKAPRSRLCCPSYWSVPAIQSPDLAQTRQGCSQHSHSKCTVFRRLGVYVAAAMVANATGQIEFAATRRSSSQTR
jgi:hypothetical protein